MAQKICRMYNTMYRIIQYIIRYIMYNSKIKREFIQSLYFLWKDICIKYVV